MQKKLLVSLAVTLLCQFTDASSLNSFTSTPVNMLAQRREGVTENECRENANKRKVKKIIECQAIAAQ